ncbi:hypothetical protein D9615_007354 [Tricholomella constricta]|uniref:Uncharacterized protein n=1 Tax=Tricholomella constricta TaxID=117010 RepID=A0A8H5H5Q6_9AGAR|nr:hypothetical protein D9615_007354 [Tricholomella constricta]
MIVATAWEQTQHKSLKEVVQTSFHLLTVVHNAQHESHWTTPYKLAKRKVPRSRLEAPRLRGPQHLHTGEPGTGMPQLGMKHDVHNSPKRPEKRSLSTVRPSRPLRTQLPLAKITSKRAYTTTRTPPPDAEPQASASQQPAEGEAEADAEKWISILENTASAPWLHKLSPDHASRLKVAYTLLFQIVLYLSRPGESEQLLLAFATAPAPPDSEIGRARTAVGAIIKAAVHQLSSVPVSSPLRREQAEVFALFGALQVIHDMYLVDDEATAAGAGAGPGGLEAWSAFWARTQPVVLELGMKLDEKGFGWTEEELGGAKKEKGKEEEKEEAVGEKEEKKAEEEKPAEPEKKAEEGKA